MVTSRKNAIRYRLAEVGLKEQRAVSRLEHFIVTFSVISVAVKVV